MLLKIRRFQENKGQDNVILEEIVPEYLKRGILLPGKCPKKEIMREYGFGSSHRPGKQIVKIP
jgi:hypothetical protein